MPLLILLLGNDFETITFLNKRIAAMPYWIRVIMHVPCRQTFTPAASHLYITETSELEQSLVMTRSKMKFGCNVVENDM